MSGTVRRLREGWHAQSRGRRIALCAAALLLIAGVIWVWPRKSERVVRSDGGGSWDRSEAPPRRQIVWRPAEPLALKASGDKAQKTQDGKPQEIVTPTLSDAGATLLFSRRSADGAADIFVVRLRDGAWSEAEPVGDLNTPADELGPVLTADGRELLFYSNRPGGLGGYDLYVAQRRDGRWTKPKNLGPRVNTTANEYDPAVSADGRTLYFASNRTTAMAERQAAGAEDQRREWSGTLRAETGERSYDLYRSEKTAGGAAWSAPKPLARVNRPGTNEGAPCLSPDGAFLFFASDRPSDSGDAGATDAKDLKNPKNLDLYRVRLAVDGDAAGPPESLGPGINTPANESEPALSAAGFRLVFASDRDGTDRLYASTATEVYAETEWDTSHLSALANPWLWLVLASSLLTLGTLALLIHRRRQLAEVVWPARFFLGSVGINLVILLLLFLWKLPGIIDAIATEDEEPTIPASRIIDPAEQQAVQSARNEYADLAEPAPVEMPQPSELARRDLADIEPVPRDFMPAPNLPADRQAVPLTAEPGVKSSWSILLPRPEPMPPVEPPDRLARRTPAVPTTPETIDETAEEIALAAVEKPAEKVPPSPAATAPRMAMTAEATVTPEAPADATPPLTPRRLPTSSEPLPIQSSRAAEVALAVPLPRRVSAVTLPRRAAMPTDEPPLELASVEPQDEQPIETADAALAITPTPAQPPLALLPNDPPQTSAETRPLTPSPLDPPPDAQTLKTLKTLTAEVAPATDAAAPLPRRTVAPAAAVGLADVPESAEIELAAAEIAEEAPLESAQVALARRENSAAEVETVKLAMPERLPPRLAAAAVPLIKIEPEPSDDEPAALATVAPLERQPAGAMIPATFTDAAELTSLLVMRDPATRAENIEVFGGSPETEAAVRRGLDWLAFHQNADGSWSLHSFHENCKGKHPNCPGAGSEHSNTAATGLAVLPFLAAGHTPGSEEFGPVVARGLDWLIAHQADDGKIQGPGDRQLMYSHGIASIALCEAYAMTKEPRYKEPAEKALRFIIAAQNRSTGGWRYTPGESGDTSVVGWQVMALKSGEMAGLAVPPATWELTRKWLASVEGNGKVGGQFGYTNRSPNPAMTAEGLLCLQFLHEPPGSPRLAAGADYIAEHLPRPDQRHTSYYWYYATQVMYHMQGEHWQAWNETMRKLLVDTQIKDGHLAGTWAPRDQWERRGGRIYATSLRLLMLEVYYRHLPLYGAAHHAH